MITELLAQFDFDWLLIDTEHGCDDYNVMLAICRPVTPAGRRLSHPRQRSGLFQAGSRSGAVGIWFRTSIRPGSSQRREKYAIPPQGIRGVSSSVRAGRYGRDFQDYFNGQIPIY